MSASKFNFMIRKIRFSPSDSRLTSMLPFFLPCLSRCLSPFCLGLFSHRLLNLGEQSTHRRHRVEAARAHGDPAADVFRNGLDEAGRRQSHRLRPHEVTFTFLHCDSAVPSRSHCASNNSGGAPFFFALRIARRLSLVLLCFFE